MPAGRGLTRARALDAVGNDVSVGQFRVTWAETASQAPLRRAQTSV